MMLPENEQLEKIKDTLSAKGYVNYTIFKKDSQMRRFTSKKESANPYYVLKNNENNRVFQVKWDGNYQNFLREIITIVEKYHS